MRFIFVVGAIISGLVSAFFVFYTARLYVVARFFTIAPRNGGAYIGAIAFPLLAVGLALVARRCWRRSRPPGAGPAPS